MSKQLKARCNFGSSEVNIDKLLTEQPTSPPLKAYNNTDYPAPAGDPDLTVPLGQTWVNTVTPSGNIKAARRDSLIQWWYEQVFKGTMHDVMTYFWSNHFGVDVDTVIEPNFCWQYYLTIRNNAMGNYRTMVRQVSLNSAMMVRLNGDTNKKGNTNKNFARELLELFTLGVGNYTEQDVNEAARVMTGFYNSYSTTTVSNVQMSVNEHDTGTKTFSSFFGGQTIAGATTQAQGLVEVDNLINMIFTRQPQTVAKLVCRKLYRFFINSELDDVYVAQMCNVFISNNWELKPVLRFMLTSAHFNDAKYVGSLVKSPVEMVANAIRDFKIKFPTDTVKKYWSINKLRQRLMRMQDIGNPPSIAGWDAYRQVPDYDKVWYNSSSAVERDKILTDLFNDWTFSLNGEGFWIDVFALARSYTNPQDPNALTVQALDILPIGFTPEEQQAVKSQCLLNGGSNDAFWTNAWNGYLAGNAANTQTVKDNLTKLFRFVITHESYQLK